MNYIDSFRAELQATLQTQPFVAGTTERSTSPSGCFGLMVTPYKSVNTPQTLARIELYQHGITERLFEVWTNDEFLFFDWVVSHQAEYLLCAENLLGGQTVVDLTNRRLASYSPEAEGFIWTEFHLSPDGRILAVAGCYWACPYVVKVLDFSAPLQLPLREIVEIELLDNDEAIVGWLDNSTLKTRGIQRIRDWLPDGKGGFQFGVVSETPVEREIQIRSHLQS